MDFGYVAVETFFPTEEYKKWSKLHNIREVISLDCALCPRIRDLDIEDDYMYLRGYGFYSDIVSSLDLLLSKVNDKNDIQILAVLREPECDCTDLMKDKRFRFYGYDLLEDFTRISALTNCGGFDKAFSPEDISEHGLIKEFDKAKQIRLLLANEYPDEEHADCIIWGIWRMEPDTCASKQ